MTNKIKLPLLTLILTLLTTFTFLQIKPQQVSANSPSILDHRIEGSLSFAAFEGLSPIQPEEEFVNGVGSFFKLDADYMLKYNINRIQFPVPKTNWSHYVIEFYEPSGHLELFRLSKENFYGAQFADFVLDGQTLMYGVSDAAFNHTMPADLFIRAYYELEDMSPVISGETAFVTNIDNPMSVEEMLTHIKAIDNEDGDISHLIKVEDDDYTPNNGKTGTFEVKLSVTDSAGNTAYLTIHVLIRDVAAPVITGQSSYTQSMTKKLSVDTVKSNLSVSDNYDNDLTIELEKDNYSSNYTKPGSHTMNFKSTDTSGNTGMFKVTINVVDDVKPTISGPTNIVKGQSEVLTINDIKAQLTANDNYDGNITDKITVKEDNYTGKGNKVGNYTIVFEVSDKAGNKTTHTVTVQVKDNIPPVFYVDNYFITVEASIKLTQQDFIDLLTATGQITVNSTTTFSTILDEYTGHEEEAGMYAMTFKTKSVDGNEEEVSVVVKVVSNEDDGTVIEPDSPNIFQKIMKGIQSFFKAIWNAFVWVKNLLLKPINWFK